MLLYEQHLQSNCRAVARRFVNGEHRTQALYVCDLLRAPFWDYSHSGIPSLLTDAAVTVYDSTGKNLISITNPISGFCYRVSDLTCCCDTGAVECMRTHPNI